MQVSIIDYGMGNVGSIQNMLTRLGAEAGVTRDPTAITRADRLILPGVGAFDAGMRNLHQSGLLPIIKQKVLVGNTPLLGICLGMQLLMGRSEEGHEAGLGWLPGRVVRFSFDAENKHLKIPHMGWNVIQVKQASKLLDELGVDSRYYFVHSYHCVAAQGTEVLATATYGHEFAAVVARGNIFGVQFHPEKSHRFGMELLRNFLQLPVEDAVAV